MADSEATKIEWTHRRLADGSTVKGYTWNGWQGCVKVSPACTNCYAERDMARLHKTVVWGPAAGGGTRPKTSADYWKKPERWARDAVAAGTRPLVFTASIADIGEVYDGPIITHKGDVLLRDPDTGKERAYTFLASPADPLPVGWHAVLSALCQREGLVLTTMDDLRLEVFSLMGRTAAGLDWLALTKRPETLLAQWTELAAAWVGGVRLALADARDTTPGRKAGLERALGVYERTGLVPNVWAGTTVENQEYADRRLPHLDLIPTPRHFVSVEPQVGPVALGNYLRPPPANPRSPEARGVHWVISGGESGPGARPAHPDWYRSLRDECVRKLVPFHFKQHGEWIAVNDALPEMVEEGKTPQVSVFPDGKAGFDDVDKQAIREGRYPLPTLNYRVGKKAAGRLLDDEEWHETPESVL